jgi:adenine-specific DNA-methyltransferase
LTATLPPGRVALVPMAPRVDVEMLSFDSRRYVGAQIGIHNPQGERVGSVSHVRNQEYVVIAGARDEVQRLVEASQEVAVGA